MHDPRMPRKLRPRALTALVLDANKFNGGLIGEILRSLDVGSVSHVRSEEFALSALMERPIDVILVSREDGDVVDGLKFVRELRRFHMDRLRRLPAILVTSAITRQLVINGRDAGVDEFLARPISPAAMRQRLEMVIETPRPFVDHAVYIGPCRRRKNPADYHGAMRREGDRTEDAPTPMIDADEVSARTPIRIALAALRVTCATLDARRPETLTAALAEAEGARAIALEQNDAALQNALAAFSTYIRIVTPAGQLDARVMGTALSTLEQLSVLPLDFREARDSVAMALGKAIQKKLAA